MDKADKKQGASRGFRDAMSCDICSEVYEQTLRTPLVLPCGHTFCRSCLTDIKKSGRFHCSTCRAPHTNLQVEALTVNYSLLNILPLCNQFECDTCTTHGDDLRYWCTKCDLPLCSICLYSGHPQGHTVKLAQTFVKEKKQELVEKIDIVFKNIEGHKKDLKKDFKELDARVMYLFKRNVHLQNTEVAVKDLLADIKKANNITSVLYFEKAVGEFQSKKKLMGLDNKTVEGKDEASEPTKVKEKNSSEEKEDPEEAASDAAKAAETIKSGQPFNASTKVPRSVMDYRDGRLLLHTVAEPVNTRLSLQVPHEVFLELGVGDKCLGRVYISLWCHLRRAQQLLALCMGTMGPSLMGAKASGKEGNTIVFRSAVAKNNESFSQALLMGLEWGGKHSNVEAEGLVTGMQSQADITFGICTRGKTNAPFGVVVAGLEVAQNALQHNPITEVHIIRCGLVLPGLSQ